MIKFKPDYINIVPISEYLINRYKSKDNMLRHLDSEDSGYMMIDKRSDKLVGYVAWENDTITALEVLKDYQGDGFSSKLLRLAVDNGCDKLTVNINNKKAISIYEHLGWKFQRNLNPKMLVYQLVR